MRMLHRGVKVSVAKKPFEIDLSSTIAAVPLRRRGTLRSLAAATGISKDTLLRRVKSGAIKRHSNAIKPFLTEKNKVERLKFCLSMVVPESIPTESP